MAKRTLVPIWSVDIVRGLPVQAGVRAAASK